MSPVFFAKKPRDLDKRRYWRGQVLVWLYSIGWLSALVFLWATARSHSWWVLAIANAALLFAMPTAGDLFESYEAYRRRVDSQQPK